MSRIYCIPDIHGRKDLLDKLLTSLYTQEKLDLSTDKLIFLGDMIDRGKDSKGVLDTVKDLVSKHPGNVVALAGNHEWLCIDACSKGTYNSWGLWLANGGGETSASFPAGIVPEEYIKWMASLPLSHEEKGFFFSHAPVPKEEYRMEKNKGEPFTKSELTWTYDSDEDKISRIHDNNVIGVCGHIHALRQGNLHPRFYDHYIFADAGCGCSRDAPLVAIDVETRKTIYALPNED